MAACRERDDGFRRLGASFDPWGRKEGQGGVVVHALRGTAESPLVVDSERGTKIQGRLDALGISDREWSERTGIDRKTLRRAVAGEERVRPTTYDMIEAALDKLEQLTAGVPTRAITDPGDDLVEFTIEGNFGVRAVVKGPVRDMAALQSAVTKLVRDMQGPAQSGDDPQNP